jgi:Na+/melibiose symporter-like transporter
LLGNILAIIFEKIAYHSNMVNTSTSTVFRNESFLFISFIWTMVLLGGCVNMTINNYINSYLQIQSNLFIYSTTVFIFLFILLLFIYSILNYKQQKQLTMSSMASSSVHLNGGLGLFSELKRTDLIDKQDD